MKEIVDLLPTEIIKALAENKIEKFTPIQNAVIPDAINGIDLVALAETGSGKTMAYLLPLLKRLNGKPKKYISALILVPTKELADQVHAEFKKFAKHTGLLSTQVYGEKSFNIQVQKFKKGLHVVIATPGRLRDHMKKNTIDLSMIDTFILDEADQMLDLGFYDRLIPIFEALPSEKTTWLFSATMSEKIKTIAKNHLRDYKLVELTDQKPKKAIEHVLCEISENEKYTFLKFLFKKEKVKCGLIFVNTKEKARLIGERLIFDKYKAFYLMGDMTKHQRKKALDGLKNGTYRFLVATDVAGRGLDITNLTHVINFDLPDIAEQYVHRLGRSARFDKSGKAISLYDKEFEEKYLSYIEDELGVPIKRVRYSEYKKGLKDKIPVEVQKVMRKKYRDDDDFSFF